jgi:hypothetical protein
MKILAVIRLSLWLACLAGSLITFNVRAFSLLGPYEPWMTTTNGFQLPGDIGGPMNLGAEYRWSVPVVTYAFDPSFIEYFGTNGVAAVNSAIQVLNNLPPASKVDLSTYPLDTTGINYRAQAAGLMDLKSETLFLLLQQLGLTQPQRFMFCVPEYSVSGGTTNAIVVLRNFDPVYLTATNVLNGTLFASNLTWQIDSNNLVESVNITAFPVDPGADTETAVADGGVATEPGAFYTGLTRDDVGGVRYLLQTNNIYLETLPPDVQSNGTNRTSFINLAPRGGVDKITFVQAAIDSLTGTFFSPITNQFTDTYLTNGTFLQQNLERVSIRPDFLFSAADLYDSNAPLVTLSSSTGTTNWINTAAWYGLPGAAGPGTIQPSVRITFNKIVGRFFTDGHVSDEVAVNQSQGFGSFDASTNPPASYPATTSGSTPMNIRIWLKAGQVQQYHDWTANSSVGTTYAMETSTNLTDWVKLFTITNSGSDCTYWVQNPTSSSRFYQIVSP